MKYFIGNNYCITAKNIITANKQHKISTLKGDCEHTFSSNEKQRYQVNFNQLKKLRKEEQKRQKLNARNVNVVRERKHF